MAIPAEKKPGRLIAARYEERKNNPPPGLNWRKVKHNETLGSIADEYNLRALDLMLYNWHTVNPLEVNWYLNHYVGCQQHNGKWYSFTGTENPGQILVPDYAPQVKKAPPKPINATRDGKATLDTKIQVRVVEWLATGDVREIAGKWLYVFSGKTGLDFGFEPPPPLPGKDAKEEWKPGTAFDPRFFPGVFHIKEKPDTIEHEILITSENNPSDELMIAVAGRKLKDTTQFKTGGHWHFLSEPAILAKATSEGRHTRTTHAFRPIKTVPIDLTDSKRYYFLLSPVQLGPEGLKYAMSNPNGLTPLLKPGDGIYRWDPTNGVDPFSPYNVAPSRREIKTGTITVPVIDPYAWAETIAEVLYPDRLAQFSKWLTSIKNFTIEKLKKETGWPTLDHLYVAKMLDSVIKNHPEPKDLLDELKDWRKWLGDLRKWETQMVEKSGDINAEAHRTLIQLIEWLKGPAHTIIDTAILNDTNTNDPVDSMDQGWGILHWSFCTENMMALAPGVKYLKEILTKSDSVPDKLVFSHLKKARNMPKRRQIAFKYAYQGVFQLNALKDFVSPSPVPFTGTRQEFRQKLSEEYQKSIEELVNTFNNLELLPFKLAPLKLSGLKDGVWNWTNASAAVNGMLDIADKIKTYIVEPDIPIPRNGFVTEMLANMEERFNKRSPLFRNGISYSVSWTLKSAALGISSYNLYKAITTASYDYQKEQSTVSGMDWASVASGSTLAIYDVISSASAMIDKEKKHLVRIFPELTKPGGKFMLPVQFTTGIGKAFAGLNVAAMFVSGVTTMVSMIKGGRQAMSVGDDSAAAFYLVGAIGGALMVTGAIALGISLIQAGAVASATGVGATVGVVLFFIGGIIAAVAGIIAAFFSSDDFEIFARKCYFGKQGEQEPRFAIKYRGDTTEFDPPDWTHALKSGTNTWPIDKQKRAIHNLLGKFDVITRIEKGSNEKPIFEGELAIEVYPGLLMEESTIEVALQYGKSGPQTSSQVKWLGENIYRQLPGQKGELFSEIGLADFNIKNYKHRRNIINIFLDKVKYDSRKGDLVATVTLRYPDHPNVIRCRKLVLEKNGGGVRADANEVTSELFE